ncbi:MAG: alpha/beta fold hydrolase, partial [Alphaproteobacteria bacterium]
AVTATVIPNQDVLPPKLAEKIKQIAPNAETRLRLLAAVQATTSSRWSNFWSGVEAYQQHPYKRPDRHRKIVQALGNTRILDIAPDSSGRPVLAIPSLVNSSDVLDLLPEQSLMDGLVEAGYRPFLVDWGNPEPDAASWTVDRYIADKLAIAFDDIAARTTSPPIILGYCMGGLLAAALAARRPIGGLVLLATPWNFHAPSPDISLKLSRMSPAFQAAAQQNGAVPVDVLQTLFFALDPMLAVRKFRHFLDIDPQSKEAERFIAMEDWVNGGPDLVAPVAATVLESWYGLNETHQGNWRVGGEVISNTSYTGPTMIATPTRDRIVPHASSRAYGEGQNHVHLLDVEGGHVGMIVGHTAQDRLWRPLFQWLNDATP